MTIERVDKPIRQGVTTYGIDYPPRRSDIGYRLYGFRMGISPKKYEVIRDNVPKWGSFRHCCLAFSDYKRVDKTSSSTYIKGYVKCGEYILYWYH